MMIQGIELFQNLLPIKLGNVDIILGIERLSGLGEIRINWKLLKLKFKKEGRWVNMQGDPTLTRLEISLKTFIKTVQDEGLGYWVELNNLIDSENNQQG